MILAMSGEVVIREATAGDLEQVVRVLRAANAEFEAVLPAPFFRAYLANVLDVRSRSTESRLFAAGFGDTGRIVGTITLYPDASKEGWGWPPTWSGIRAVAVEPDARGLGIGCRLADACIESARALGAPAVCLHTAPFMAAAIRMYEDVGFRRVPRYDGDAGDMVGSATVEPRIPALAYLLDLEQQRSAQL
jgi:ribosomal protein S18 acetylase RimI-like enzyme